jgi:RNA polymerase sigma-70 factor (ECF subfamily)
MTSTPPDLAQAREHFLSMVEDVRPDLHRYCARLVGSAIEGEDVVQDALAKAFYALSLSAEVPALRPWLFRIARNAAIDHLRRYERHHVGPLTESEVSAEDPGPDPEVLRAALASFLTLPVSQRSAVILKDVLGESLEDIATQLDTSVEAVKALLVRGRASLRASQEERSASMRKPLGPEARALLQRYVLLFNQRDWETLRSLLREEVELDLVSKSQRKGKAVGAYFGRYEKETDLELRVVRVEGRDAIGVYGRGVQDLRYVILLEVRDGQVALIRDFRYVPYLARELEVESA